MPFSDRWFYGDALFIVDPWMYVLLGGGVWLADRLDRRARPGAVRAARAALLCVALYVAGMLASTQAARAVVRDGLVRAGRPADSRFMVSPVPVNPFRREVIVDVGPRYEKGFVWFEPAPRFRPAGYGADKGFDQEDVSALMQTDLVRTYLKWARFPFFVVDRGTRPPTVLLNDYRYSDATARPGWAGFQLRLGTP
jgi:inner membrane protein